MGVEVHAEPLHPTISQEKAAIREGTRWVARNYFLGIAHM
jgi:hypothetical protein